MVGPASELAIPGPAPVQVAAFYRFAPLDGLQPLQQELLTLAAQEDVRGTILLAAEGVNGTIAGPEVGVQAVLQRLRQLPGLERLRSFEFRAQWIGKGGVVMHEDTTTFSWQNRLLVDEERRWAAPAGPKAVALRVRVDHNFADRKPTTVVDRTWELQ